jgi:RNA polymerase sigma factor (sigma-70 family)
MRLAQKHDAAPALGKLSQELEKLQVILRRYAVDPAHCADLVRRTHRQLLSTPPRISVQELESYILRKAREDGRDYLRRKVRRKNVRFGGVSERGVVGKRQSTADEATLEDERVLLCHAMNRELPPRCSEVFQLNRYEELSHKQIARHLNLKVSTVKRYLVRAMRVFARVQRELKHEGVVE